MAEFTAISLHQPYASLLVTTRHGRVKVHETRGRPAPPKHLGKRIAIHAAQRRVVPYELTPAVFELCVMHFGDDFADTLPYGAYVGTVILATSLRIPYGDRPVEGMSAGPVDEDDFECGDWAPGRWAWRADEPYPITPPFPDRGRQGWWTAHIEPAP